MIDASVIPFICFMAVNIGLQLFDDFILKFTLIHYQEELLNKYQQETAEKIEFKQSEITPEGNVLFSELKSELGISDGEETLSITDYDSDALSNPPKADPVWKQTKISERRKGYQIWKCRIIGLEYNYIHVYDGDRAWIEVDNINDFNQNDIIECIVDRDASGRTKLGEVIDIFRVDLDYVIPDEIEVYAG